MMRKLNRESGFDIFDVSTTFIITYTVYGAGVKKCKTKYFFGQVSPIEEFITTVCGVSYQLLAVMLLK